MTKVFDTTLPFKCGCTVKEEYETREGYAKGLRIIPDILCPDGTKIWEDFEEMWDKIEWLTWFEPEGQAVKNHFSAENQVG